MNKRIITLGLVFLLLFSSIVAITLGYNEKKIISTNNKQGSGYEGNFTIIGFMNDIGIPEDWCNIFISRSLVIFGNDINRTFICKYLPPGTQFIIDLLSGFRGVLIYFVLAHCHYFRLL